MATIKEFKQEIAWLVIKQRSYKELNYQSATYDTRGILHCMYTAYYIIKHNLDESQTSAYLSQVISNWKSLKHNGWRGFSYIYNAEKYFIKHVKELVEKYEEVVCISE